MPKVRSDKEKKLKKIGNLTTLNGRIKYFRNSIGLTQEQFGNKIGLSKMCLSEIENGRRKVTTENIKVISTVFGIDEYWLTGEQQRKGEIVMKKTIFQKRLKELRTEENLSQKQLGLLSGLGEEIIHLHEDHGYEPNNYIIRKLAETFKVSPEYLMGIKDDQNYNPAEILKIIPTDDLINELRRRVAKL